MLRGKPTDERFSYNYGTPRTHKKEEFAEGKERKIAIYGLFLSVLVIAVKTLVKYRGFIDELLLEQQLVTYHILSEDGNEMLKYSWKKVARYSHIWFPAICGILSSYFTWIMVYLDSDVPGVQPPSPLSPKKLKDRSGHTFHLNYVFALLVGTLVFLYMYLKGASIQY